MQIILQTNGESKRGHGTSSSVWKREKKCLVRNSKWHLNLAWRLGLMSLEKGLLMVTLLALQMTFYRKLQKLNKQGDLSPSAFSQPHRPSIDLVLPWFELWWFHMSIKCSQSHFRITADLLWRQLNNWKHLPKQRSLPPPTQQNIIYSQTVSHSSAGDWNGRFVLQPMKYWMEIHIQKTCKIKTCYEKKMPKTKMWRS